MRTTILSGLALLAATAISSPSLAAWPNSSFTNLPVCEVGGSQTLPQIVSDGAGGAIVGWVDLRAGTNYDVYAQRVLASGVVDPSWPAGGRALCVLPSHQIGLRIASDGAGGAIFAWQDARNSAVYDVYAQHVLASGVIDPAWPADGRAVCTATNGQSSIQVVPDGAGGAVITWQDSRGANVDIYAQRVLASGVVDPAWPADGRALCTATGNQQEPHPVPDGAGGAIVAWQDLRNGNYDIYAQHVLASGSVAPGWGANGIALCLAANSQLRPRVASDGAGGAVVTWQDFRSGSSFDIFAQHVTAAGGTSWPVDGVVVCDAAGDQAVPEVVTDGVGGAIATWHDGRAGNNDIYVQRIPASGVMDPAWPANGRVLCDATGNQDDPKLASDGAGGAIVTWKDLRTGSLNDVYAAHVFASGAVDAAWAADGNPVSNTAGDQASVQIVADGLDGAIVTWNDTRNSDFDLYAQRIGRHGFLGTPEPELVAVEDVPNDDGGVVKLSWSASYLDQQSHPELDIYDVLRSVPPAAVDLMRMQGARVHAFADSRGDARPGDVFAQATAAATYYWEYLTAISARHYLGGYSYLAATPGDSIAGSNPETAFMIVARNSSNTMWWPSRPMSGYSVDDLAPAAPAPFTGHFSAGITHLHWNPNTEADLAGYRLYRGTTAGFTPDEATLVAALPDTGYADAAGTAFFYKLTAVDVHGNQSPVATLSPSGTVGAGARHVAHELSFAAPVPNPANASSLLRYSLPRAAVVRFAVYDAAGRLVCEVASGARPAGDHAESWDLRDTSGRVVRAGLYFARFEAEGRTLIRRIAVAR